MFGHLRVTLTSTLQALPASTQRFATAPLPTRLLYARNSLQLLLQRAPPPCSADPYASGQEFDAGTITDAAGTEHQFTADTQAVTSDMTVYPH